MVKNCNFVKTKQKKKELIKKKKFFYTFLQLIYVLRTQTPNALFYLSIALSVYSIASSVVKSDAFTFSRKANKKCPPTPMYCARMFLRILEIATRFITVVLLWLEWFGLMVIGLLLFEFLIYLYFYSQDLLGNFLSLWFSMFLW